jgi:aminoglycoside/choline kinase family phosphotransferase
MDAPPEKEDCAPFVQIAKKLSEIGLNAPIIHRQSLKEGFLVLSDFGDCLLEQAIQCEPLPPLYQQAIDELISLQCKLDKTLFNPFDATHIRQELSLFDTWYLKKHLGLKNHPDLSKLYEFLIDEALSMPSVAMHRDYHCRNLMRLSTGGIGILDFQDMMQGPILYDLASLLKDCYLDLGKDRRASLVNYFLDNNPLLSSEFKNDCQRSFDLIACQRHLKASGIFCRLNYRDNKANYLSELPLVLKYLRATADKYSELRLLKDLLNEIKTN